MNVFAEHSALTRKDVPEEPHPTNFKTIIRHQQNDAELIETATKNKILIKQFHGAGKQYSLICFNNIIVIPK